MKIDFLVILYDKKHVRSFLQTGSFELLFKENKFSSALVCTNEISHLIQRKKNRPILINLDSKIMINLGTVLYSCLLWRKRDVAETFYLKAMFNFAKKSDRIKNLYPDTKIDISGKEMYRFLIRFLSTRILFEAIKFFRLIFVKKYLSRLFNNLDLNLLEIKAVFIPFSGLISPVFDDLVNFFNSKGIKTIAIQDNWDNVCSKTFINSQPSYFCVWGAQSAGHLTYFHRLKNTSIIISGSSRLLPYYSNKKQYKDFQKIPIEIKRHLNQKYVLFAGNGEGIDDDCILDSIQKVKHSFSNFQIVYRPHPFVRTKINRKKLDSFRDLGIIVDLSGNSSHVFHHCGIVMNADLIITQGSTLILEGLHSNKKILIPSFVCRKVNFDYTHLFNTYPHLLGLSAFPNFFFSKSRSTFEYDLVKAIKSQRHLSKNSAHWFAAKYDTNKILLDLANLIYTSY